MRSQALLEKEVKTRVLSKAQGVGEVIKLLDDFQQAILVYNVCTIGQHQDLAELTHLGQPSQQRSIDSQVAQLTVSFLPSFLPVELMSCLSDEVVF